MSNIAERLGDCEIDVRAGMGGESDDNIFRYVSSSLPNWVKTVDDPIYRKMTQSALSAARDVVQATGKTITLKYSVNF